MTLPEMLDDLPRAPDVGVKRGVKGYQASWSGYKLHIDAADGGISLSGILTSASLHGSLAAIPLATVTVARVTNLYDLMDSACDAPGIRAHSASMGHVAIIDVNPRSTARKRQLPLPDACGDRNGKRLGASLVCRGWLQRTGK